LMKCCAAPSPRPDPPPVISIDIPMRDFIY
jgi:hypothetical protein